MDFGKRRIVFILLGMTGAIGFLTVKLFWIQVIDAESYSSKQVNLVKNAVLQRQSGIVLDSGRGDFYDRNGKALTGETKEGLILFPIDYNFRGNDLAREQLAPILGVNVQQLNVLLQGLEVPTFWRRNVLDEFPTALTKAQIDKIRKLNIPFARIAVFKTRYPDTMAARHLIGFVSQDPERIVGQYAEQLSKGQLSLKSEIGGAGLEKTFQPWLKGVGETSLSFFTDGTKKPLFGLNYRWISPENPNYPMKVMTTLDVSIQKGIESIISDMGLKEAAVVVLDASNSDIVAMASWPQYDPGNIQLSSSAWGNKVLKAYTPGSIFKTVIAAAALEEKVVKRGEVFTCNGSYGKYGLTCWDKDGHGALTFEEAYAESCNVVFAKVMERLNAKDVELYTKRLGIGEQTGWLGDAEPYADFHQLDAEESGQLFASSTMKDDRGVLAQTSIGQRDVQMTPLQAANLVVTLLNGGELHEPRAVKEIKFATGDRALAFPEHKQEEKGISPRTANAILSMMQGVVREGTGTYLQHAKWELAGKSGTAETLKEGKPVVHQWFIGYGPVQHPRYSVAVLVPNAPEGPNHKATLLFKEVMDLLAKS